MKASCAVLVRGTYDEAPFLNEFLRHYTTLGFDRIYYINTHSSDDYIRRVVSPDLSNRLSVLPSSNSPRDWQESVLNQALSVITEDWVLNIDMDELLCLGTRNVTTYLSTLPQSATQVRFPWLMCVSRRFANKSVFSVVDEHASPSRSFKTMTRTASLLSLGIHDAVTAEGAVHAPVAYSDRAFLFHFACRGLYDLINRIIGRNYQNDKSGTLQETLLRRFFSENDLPLRYYPFRFQMYRVELSFPVLVVEKPISIPELTDTTMLRAVLCDKLGSIGIDVPSRYFDVLEDYLEDRYQIRSRLLSSVPPPSYAQCHLQNGMSYINITKAYVADLCSRGGGSLQHHSGKECST